MSQIIPFNSAGKSSGTSVRKPSALTAIEKSFAPLPHDELPDFYGYRQRNRRKKGAKVHELTELEMSRAVAALSTGATHSYAIRVVFSSETDKPVAWSSLSSAQITAAKYYLSYLCRNHVKVTQVRNGQTGLIRTQLISACEAVKEYHKKRTVYLRKAK